VGCGPCPLRPAGNGHDRVRLVDVSVVTASTEIPSVSIGMVDVEKDSEEPAVSVPFGAKDIG
jgi:hypothetical protein